MHTPTIAERILLVDDDEVSCYINFTILRKAGFTGPIDMVHDGADALEYLRTNCPILPGDSPFRLLLFLDLNMPNMGGADVLEELTTREDINTKGLYITILSSGYTKKDIEQTSRYPLAGYLTKPLTEKKAVDLLASLETFNAATEE